jgi:hypothetical protein
MERKIINYSALMASFGQTLAHFKQPEHFSLSTVAIPPLSKEIAPMGHRSMHFPQPRHLFSSTATGIDVATAYAEPARRQRTASITRGF